MQAPEEDVEAHALRKQGWTISTIARHLDRDRKAVRAYLAGERQPGVRRAAGPHPGFGWLVAVIPRSARSATSGSFDILQLDNDIVAPSAPVADEGTNDTAVVLDPLILDAAEPEQPNGC